VSARKTLVENELSRMLLGGEIEPGDRVRVDLLEGDLRFDVEPGRARASDEVTESSEETEPARGAA
jgi:hypothetical protein